MNEFFGNNFNIYLYLDLEYILGLGIRVQPRFKKVPHDSKICVLKFELAGHFGRFQGLVGKKNRTHI